MIHTRIYFDLWTPKVFVRTMWAKTRGLSEFQLLLITPRQSAPKISVKRCPSAPKGVTYQLANCMAIQI